MSWYQYLKFQLSEWKNWIFAIIVFALLFPTYLLIENRLGGSVTWDKSPITGTIAGKFSATPHGGNPNSNAKISVKLSTGRIVAIETSKEQLPLIVKGEKIELLQGENKYGFKHYRLVNSQ